MRLALIAMTIVLIAMAALILRHRQLRDECQARMGWVYERDSCVPEGWYRDQDALK